MAAVTPGILSKGSTLATTVTDLDVHVPENKKVVLSGKEYVLPGDVPMEVFLRLQAAGDNEDELAGLEAMLDVIGDLFAWVATEDIKDAVRHDVKAVLRGRGVKFCFQIVKNIYQEDNAAEVIEGSVAEDAPPTPATGDGTTST